MTTGDRVIVGIVLALALLSVPAAIASALIPGESAVIFGPHGETRVPLDIDGTYSVEGRTGTVDVCVEEGKVWVLDAQCPDGLCERSGVARPGRPVVCAPNGVSISLSLRRGGVLDAVSR